MRPIDPSYKYTTVTITTPARTASKTTVWDFSLGMDVILEELKILFAPGHVALTGVRVMYGGEPLIPWGQRTAFIAGDNERLPFDVGMYISTPLTIVTTNNDTYQHSHVLVSKYREVSAFDVQAAPGQIVLL